MLSDLLPFPIRLDTVLLTGIALWSLALYLGFFPVGEWVMEQLTRWMNFADRSLYTSAEYERTRKGRESQNAFYASLLSIVPFLGAGGICNWLMELSLGRSWAISVGILACIGCGVYELGRRDGQSID
ncbi:hypothetical protein [Leptolyngbya sp. FACHB-711]|uniref:hypothetical protein n=1 Tax=unclassified Leptolyngbya TaxID=2650499 RepID=UPI0016849104|nr:hypothetical protein [Leptolyngbya sp. FACHB-711]MBD1852033.1 hypothetical protein [Cyanobacteria bacterium FACHB-502]MBD2023003.1 hypothetical protein [Leptolyngbya sp. FACHB-711]